MVYLDQFSDGFLNGFFYELGFGGGCGSGGKVVPLEQFSHRVLKGFFYELGFGGWCGSGGKVVYLEQFSDRCLNGFLCELGFGGECGSGGKVVYLEQFSEGAVLENSARAPYPTPKLGISARHAVSNLSGCGGGAPHPILTPHP